MSRKLRSSKDIRDLNRSERFQLLKDTFSGFTIDTGLFHGAALSFYVIFAMVPIIYLAVTVFGLFIGQATMLKIISNLLTEQVGISDVSGIISFLESVDFGKGNFILRNIGVIALLISSSAIFISLKNSMNFFFDLERIYDSKRKKFFSTLISRAVSIGLLSLFGAVLVVAYFAQVILISFGHKILGDSSYFSSLVIEVLQHVIGIASNWVVFGFVFKYLHDGEIDWKLAWSGSFVTAVMLHSGQLLIQYYLSNFFFAKDGGIVGALLVILAYMYYSSQMIFIGARFTAVYAKAVGRPITVKESKKDEVIEADHSHPSHTV